MASGLDKKQRLADKRAQAAADAARGLIQPSPAPLNLPFPYRIVSFQRSFFVK